MLLSQRDAQASLAANNYELKKRRIAVTMADSRRSKRYAPLSPPDMPVSQWDPPSAVTTMEAREAQSRSVRIRNLPPGTQEGLLQQVLEKVVRVKRVEVFLDKNEAVAEMENTAVCTPLTRTDSVIIHSDL